MEDRDRAFKEGFTTFFEIWLNRLKHDKTCRRRLAAQYVRQKNYFSVLDRQDSQEDRYDDIEQSLFRKAGHATTEPIKQDMTGLQI